MPRTPSAFAAILRTMHGMTRFLFICHPADLEDEGIDAALARLRGEIGVDGIILRAATPARTALRPRVTGSPKIVSHESAVWFQPDAKHYAGTRIRPHVAHAIKSRNFLARICDAAVAQGLSVRARIDLFDSLPLAAKHPTATCVDVYGRPHESQLCPSNPDVREFAAAVVEDLCANYPIDSVEHSNVEFGPFYTFPVLSSAFELGEVGTALLNWCVCPACRQRAGESIDVSMVIKQSQALLSEIFHLKGMVAVRWPEIISDHVELAGYERMRAGAIASLVGMIRQRCNKPLWMQLTDFLNLEIDYIHSVSKLCDGNAIDPARLHPSREQSGVPRIAGTTNIVLASIGTPERASIECGPPKQGGGEFVSTVHDAARRGYAAIAFSDYGLAAEPQLEWTRQAVRYARREVSS